MLYTKLISQYKEFGYPEFRKMYGEMQYSLSVYGMEFEDSEVRHNIEVCKDLKVILFEMAKSVLSDLHMEDDEYGTLAYTGYPRTYSQCAYRLLEEFERFARCEVVAVIYDGEINSVWFRHFQPDLFVTKTEFEEV